MRGTVKWFNEQKGFGFLTGTDGKDAFLHASNLPETIDGGELTDGRAVEFEVEQGPKGPRVKTIKLLASTAAILLLAGTMLIPGLMLTGCNDLHARGAMAVVIDNNAQNAAEIKPQAVAGNLTMDKCIATMAENEAAFALYAAAKTLNWFDYAFGDKTIWCNPTYAALLDNTAALANETTTQATTRPAAWCNGIVAVESSVLIKVKQAKDGKKE